MVEGWSGEWCLMEWWVVIGGKVGGDWWSGWW